MEKIKDNSRRKFLKKTVYTVPTIIALGALAPTAVAGGSHIGSQRGRNSGRNSGGNNGFGNGDQDAPGGSEHHNNAENAGGN